MIEDTGILLLWVFVTWILSNFIIGFMDAFATVKHQVETDVIKHINNIVHLVKLENHGDVEYWFDKDSDEFLAQGANFEEIRDTLKSRFPNHVFFCKNQEDQVIMLAGKNNWEPVLVDQDMRIKL